MNNFEIKWVICKEGIIHDYSKNRITHIRMTLQFPRSCLRLKSVQRKFHIYLYPFYILIFHLRAVPLFYLYNFSLEPFKTFVAPDYFSDNLTTNISIIRIKQSFSFNPIFSYYREYLNRAQYFLSQRKTHAIQN